MKPWHFALAGLMLVPLALGLLTAFPRVAATTPATAQGTGSITGQVVWCAPFPIRAGVPGAAPAESGVATQEGPAVAIVPGQEGLAPGQRPEVQPDGTVRPGPIPIPIPRPVPPRPIPAGAVLVAVQNTSLSARTDEGGNFRIDGVPIGQYYTVAAGPVQNAPAAVGMRPNVYVASSGATVNLGQMSLGGPCPFGPLPLGVPGATEVQP